MRPSSEQIDVYLETGKRRIFAGAIDWPGWCRSGRDEESALQTLLDYGPRYQRALRETSLAFEAPAEVAALSIVERLEGDATTDYGAPGAFPAADERPVDEAELQQMQAVLEACWQTFDRAVETATGKELRKGPRGGGRDLDKIVRHVIDADVSYLRRIGQKHKTSDETPTTRELSLLRQAIRDGLLAAARGNVPARGPRGGVRWSARYFVRRVAWHVLDHAWEIEDRVS